MKHRKVITVLILGGLLLLSLACMGTTPISQPTQTPQPTHTDLPTVKPPTEKPMSAATEEEARSSEIEGVDTPITISWNGTDTELQFYGVQKLESFKWDDGSVSKPSTGNIFLLVIANIYSGGGAIESWPTGRSSNCVHLLTESGEKYWWSEYGSSETTAGWFFDVPPSTLPKDIFLPGGVSVDISSLSVE
jgi:hypothetical protein